MEKLHITYNITRVFSLEYFLLKSCPLVHLTLLSQIVIATCHCSCPIHFSASKLHFRMDVYVRKVACG